MSNPTFEAARQAYGAAERARQARITENRQRRIAGLPALPTLPKPERPLVPIAYTLAGVYEGRLASPEELPAGCVLRWEPLIGC